jgi:hypothetical protein
MTQMGAGRDSRDEAERNPPGTSTTATAIKILLFVAVPCGGVALAIFVLKLNTYAWIVTGSIAAAIFIVAAIAELRSRHRSQRRL